MSRNSQAGQLYVYGNAVRKEESIPQRIPRQFQEPPRRNPNVRKNRNKALSMNAPYVVFLAAAVFACLTMCVGYIMIRTENMRLSNDITSLKQQIEAVSTQNDALDYSINSFIDVNNIIKVATEELGMVKSSKDNIKLYDGTEREYMNQYAEIPQ
ncbi:hypothetical protein [Parasporobacterium paucivorans]|uniref:Cell division protein FtsL n=1 Tax=Parasporobacterium paucivorans DSM 15970 TaxID=1122934 RepID=A0A1M6G362_9FIRM|nr:hypothetical protein [Parasporobacterium paucivorans]SHJ04354.1 cell division protein FtsL [Parasporobacterium paucivorans DSM 15970]